MNKKKFGFILIVILIFGVFYYFSFSKSNFHSKDHTSNLKEKNQKHSTTFDSLSDNDLAFFDSLMFNNVKIGYKLQDFNLKKMDNLESQINLYSLSKGQKYSLLMHIQSWCPYCKKEMISLNKFLQNNKNDNLKVLVYTDEQEKEKINKILNFKKENNLNNFDFYVADKNYFENFGLSAVPAEVVFKENGDIVVVSIGFKEWNKKVAIDSFRKLGM